MTALRERPTQILLALLLALGGLLTWPIVSTTRHEDQFWAYITTHLPGPPTFSRHYALSFSDVLCGSKPVSNIEVRNWLEYADVAKQAAHGLSAKKRAIASAVPVITEATFRYVCPVTKHLPAKPRHDLVAGFPLPTGTVLDDDPVLGHSDDDSTLSESPNDKYRTADYLAPDHVTLKDLARFYKEHVRSGVAWKGWSWCKATNEGADGKGGTYIWQRGKQDLFLSWYAVKDDLVHAPGTLMISVSAYNQAKSRTLPDCG